MVASVQAGGLALFHALQSPTFSGAQQHLDTLYFSGCAGFAGVIPAREPAKRVLTSAF